MVASNITNTRKIRDQNAGCGDPCRAGERWSWWKTRIIDGRKCLVIPMEDVEINGIRVRMGSDESDDSDNYEEESV